MRVLRTSIERESTLLYTCCQEIQEPWLSAPRLGAKLCHGCEIPSTHRRIKAKNFNHRNSLVMTILRVEYVCRQCFYRDGLPSLRYPSNVLYPPIPSNNAYTY